VGTANIGSRASACPLFIVALRERGFTVIHDRRPRSGCGRSGKITFLTLMPKDNQGLDMETSSKSNGFNEYRAIWSRGLIMSTLLLLFVYTAGNFAYYGMVVLTSELNNSSRSCASVGAHLKKTKDFHLYINVLVTNFAGRLCSGQI
jgi:hypothetical protein